MARNMNQQQRRSIPGRRDASPHSDGLAAMGADAGASVALGGPAPLGYASYEAGGPLDSTLHNYASNGAQQQQQQHGGAHTDYSSAQSLSAHGSSPGGASPHAPQASFYNAPGAGPTGNYGGVEDAHQAPVRGHHLPPLSEALHSSNDAAQGHDDSHRFAHNVGPGGPAYDDQHFLDAHMMHPPANSNSGAGVHDYSNGAAASGATHFQQPSNGAASSAGMMTPPPGSSHGAGSSHGGYQSYYAPPAHMMHRASISGPVMSHYPTHPSVGGATSALAGHSGIGAPPAAGDFAAWGNASGSARPHTADGMFGGQFGLGAPQWPGALPTGGGYSMRGPRASISSMSSMTEQSPSSIGSKTFSYMAGADDIGGGPGGGSGAKKRPRRRYDEIERLYPCSFPGCAKSYGTLNHLNAHVAMQKHGQKRAPGEFKEMRKQWRKGKREEEQRRQSHGGSDDHMGHRGSISSSYGGTPGPVAHGYPSAGSMSGYVPPMGMPSQIPRYSLQHGSAGGNFSAMQPPSHYPAQSAPLDPNGRPYSSAGAPPQVQQQHQGAPSGLGAYLMAHRGSI